MYGGYFLNNQKPGKYSWYLLILWAADLFLLLVAPDIADKMAYFPHIEGFSHKIIFSAFTWGWSKQISITAFMLSSAIFWFFGFQAEKRMTSSEFWQLIIGSNLVASAIYVLLSLKFVSGVQVTAPAASFALAYAIWWFYQSTPLLWKNYHVGNISVFKWFLWGGIAFNALVETLNGYFPVFSFSMLGSLLFAAWFFDHRIFIKKYRKFLFKRRAIRGGRWGKRNGKWGYWN